MNKSDIKKLVYKYAEENLNKKAFVRGVSPVPASGAVLYPKDIADVTDALLEFWYTDWKQCAKFRSELCKVTNKKFCVLTNSGSSASLLAQAAMAKINQLNKYVVTTALGFPTTVYPIWQVGREPIFIDMDFKTLSPSIDEFREIDRNMFSVAGMVFAHTLGFPFNEHDFFFAKGKEDFVIHDCCDALSARFAGIHVGSFADIITFSFFPAHHITSGEGGAVLTDSEDIYRELSRLANWGRDCDCVPGVSNSCGERFSKKFRSLPEGYDHKYIFSSLGYNFKMTEFQAALGYAQLRHLDYFAERRRINYKYLKDELSDIEHFDFVEEIENSDPSPFGFPIIVNSQSPFSAKELIAHLESNKIATRRFFGGNLTRQPFIKDLPYIRSTNLTQSDHLMSNAFWIGCWPGLTSEHLDFVLDIIYDFVRDSDAKT